ncbi:unnamed protein product [Rotaria sordida]|nr:unnamed protein product [Rotaria sordida]
MRDETHVNDALNTEYDALKYSRKKIVLAVLGCAKSAKSSFINYLLEEKIYPVDTLSATARVTRIIYGSQWKVYLEGEQGEEINDIDSLYRKAIELIVLKGDDRNDETKCKMKVIIELPIKQLKNVELWDLPGLNENPVLDGIVSTILSDVDLVFALLPINGGVLSDFLNNIKKCLIHNPNVSGVMNETHNNDRNIARFQRQMIMEIVNGLHYLHNRTRIHRDIKPTNILVRKCEPPVFLISGLSFLRDLSCSIKDTPYHMAPELTNVDNLTNDSTQPM